MAMESQKTGALFGVLEQMQHHHLTRALQGLLPPTVNAHKLKQVLDLNCYGGNWAIDLVLSYPGVTVTALHNEPEAIALGRQSAFAGGLNRVQFYEADIREPLNLASSTFDLVHIFTSYPLIRRARWPAFLEECWRVMKPGATINLVDFVFGPGSSAAYQRFLLLADELRISRGYGFSDKPGASAPGVYFCRLLRQAGFMQDSYLIRPVNLGGWNNAPGRACCQRFFIDVVRGKPFFLKYASIDAEEFDRLAAQAEKDITEVDFCASGAVISAFATKK